MGHVLKSQTQAGSSSLRPPYCLVTACYMIFLKLVEIWNCSGYFSCSPIKVRSHHLSGRERERDTWQIGARNIDITLSCPTFANSD